jgi:hypothetical protein
MSRRRRRLVIALLVAPPIAVVALWLAVHRVPWLGPSLADGLRSVLGTRAVAWLETVAYGLEDRVNRIWRKDEAPKVHWQAELPADGATREARRTARVSRLPPFRPADVGPVAPRVTTPVDGVWIPIRLGDRDLGSPILYKTQLHPDAKRPWAELFVVAIDLRRARLHVVAGSRDPEPVTRKARDYDRPARVPPHHHASLLAAFNGGFKTEHGQYGMMVDDVVLVPPREHSCTIAASKDGTLAVAPWKKLAESGPRLLWWRQTPPCLYQNGKMHGSLWEEETRSFGAAVGGDVVIRRSAIGLGPERAVLYVGISNFTTARAIADGMRHAGAHDVAQLDVNWTFPKFLIYQQGENGTPRAEVLVEGFVFEPDEYVARRSPRDFFYVVAAEP